MFRLTASPTSSSYLDRCILFSCLLTYLCVRSITIKRTPLFSTDSLCLCIMVSTDSPTYNRKWTNGRRSSKIYGACIARVPAALCCGPWQGNPFLSTYLCWIYVIINRRSSNELFYKEASSFLLKFHKAMNKYREFSKKWQAYNTYNKRINSS